ncbi:hypothetical protein EG878_17175, partial [Enterococcus faecalis]
MVAALGHCGERILQTQRLPVLLGVVLQGQALHAAGVGHADAVGRGPQHTALGAHRAALGHAGLRALGLLGAEARRVGAAAVDGRPLGEQHACLPEDAQRHDVEVHRVLVLLRPGVRVERLAQAQDVGAVAEPGKHPVGQGDQADQVGWRLDPRRGLAGLLQLLGQQPVVECQRV